MAYGDYQIKSCKKAIAICDFNFRELFLFDSNYFIYHLIKKITQVELKKQQDE